MAQPADAPKTPAAETVEAGTKTVGDASENGGKSAETASGKAQGKSQEEIDRELAKQYYMLGEQLFNRGDYAGAVRQFSASYRHSKLPALLFNIARCHEAVGQHEEALGYFEQYKATNPPNAALIEKRIGNLKVLIAKKKNQQDAQQPKPDPEVTPKPDPEPGSPTKSRPLRAAGWALVGLGVAGVGAGVALGVLANNKAGELEDDAKAGADWADVKSKESQGKNFNMGGIIAMSVGGAALATGVVLVILDARKQGREKQDSQAWIAPTILARGAGVSAGFEF